MAKAGVFPTPKTTSGALWPAYVMGICNTLLALLTAFGVALSQEQTAAIIPFVNAVLLFAANVSVSKKAHADYVNGRADEARENAHGK